MTISVIVPVYNVDQYLSKCINSIINQTYTSLEIILIDDGSTDNSGNICDEYRNKDSRIRVVHQENKGLSAARNIGMKIAKGDWISFIDSDDWIDLDMYSSLLDLASKYDADLVLCEFVSIIENGTYKNRYDKNEAIYSFTNDELISAYIEKKEGYSISTSVWDRLYKRELLENIEFPVGRVNEDIFFTVEIFCRSKKAIYVNQPYYFYRENRNGSITASIYSKKRIDDNTILTEQAVEYLKNKNKIELAELMYSDFYLQLSDLYINQKNVEVKQYIYGYIKKNRKRIWYLIFRGKIKISRKIGLFLNCISPHLRNRIVKIYVTIKNI